MADNYQNYDPKAENEYNQENEPENYNNYQTPSRGGSGLAITSLILGILSIAFCMGPLTGIPGIICGHIARSKATKGEAGGAGLALGGLISSYLGTLLVGLYLLFMVALVAPAISVAHNKAQEVKCMNNLKQIAMGLIMYAADNREELPPYDGAEGLELLRSKGYIVDTKVFICPACDTEPAPYGEPLTDKTCDYNYKGGLKIGDGDFDQILVWDKENNHKDYGNAVFMDGHVESRRGQNWKSEFDNSNSVDAKPTFGSEKK